MNHNSPGEVHPYATSPGATCRMWYATATRPPAFRVSPVVSFTEGSQPPVFQSYPKHVTNEPCGARAKPVSHRRTTSLVSSGVPAGKEKAPGMHGCNTPAG